MDVCLSLKKIFILFDLILVLFSVSSASSDLPNKSNAGQKLIVAAHYAPWFSSNGGGWFGKAGNKKVHTAYTPLLGYYDNLNFATLSKHIEWANAYGTNTFMIEWSGVWSDTFPHSFESVVHTFLGNPDFKKINFFFVYSITGAFEKKGGGTPTSVDFNDTTIVNKLLSDIKYAAKIYFIQPNQLKIQGKPVIYIWAIGAARGNIKSAFTRVRKTIKSQYGMDLYLIADEVGWGSTPDLTRTPIWDAVMPYGMLKVQNPIRNYKLESSIPEIILQYQNWYNVCNDLKMNFIPGVWAGFNPVGAPWCYDKNGKLATPIVARSPASFKKFIDEAKPLIDPNINMFYITSWSEWNEGTNIEPSKEFGFDYLSVVKKGLSAFKPAKPPKDVVKFQFKRVWNPPGPDERLLSAMFDYVKFFDANEKVLLTINIGTDAARKYMGIGWSGNEETSGDPKNFVWAGDKYKYATLHLDLPSGTKFIKFRALQIEPPQSISVYLNAKSLGTFPVQNAWQWIIYQVELP